jgi:hypothetical protein
MKHLQISPHIVERIDERKASEWARARKAKNMVCRGWWETGGRALERIERRFGMRGDVTDAASPFAVWNENSGWLKFFEMESPWIC